MTSGTVALLAVGLPAAGAVLGLVGIRVARVVGERARRVALNDLLVRLTSPATVDRVQSALREIMADPSVVVLYRPDDSAEQYLDADGREAQVPATPERLVLAGPTNSAGRPLVVVHLAMPRSPAERLRAETAVTACAPALLNARLQILTQVRVRELRESRARMVAAAVEERRRLERNLHDGAQTPLLAVSTRLSVLRTRLADTESLTIVDAARTELRDALGGLRAMTRELFPAVLDSDGLAAALEETVDTEEPEDLEVALDVSDVAGRRFAADVESIAYLTVADVLTGLRRDLGTRRVKVTVVRREEFLLLSVKFALPRDIAATMSGTVAALDLPWLTVVADRLRAVGGELTASTVSSANGETDAAVGPVEARVEARVACE